MAKNSKKKTRLPSTESKNADTAAPAKKPSVGPWEFVRQVRAEVRKVTWTSKNETMISTIMVLIMVVIMSAFFFVVDWAAREIVQLILSLG